MEVVKITVVSGDSVAFVVWSSSLVVSSSSVVSEPVDGGSSDVGNIVDEVTPSVSVSVVLSSSVVVGSAGESRENVDQICIFKPL